MLNRGQRKKDQFRYAHNVNAIITFLFTTNHFPSPSACQFDNRGVPSMPTMSANIMSKQIRTTQLLLSSLSYLKKYMHGQI